MRPLAAAAANTTPGTGPDIGAGNMIAALLVIAFLLFVYSRLLPFGVGRKKRESGDIRTGGLWLHVVDALAASGALVAVRVSRIDPAVESLFWALVVAVVIAFVVSPNVTRVVLLLVAIWKILDSEWIVGATGTHPGPIEPYGFVPALVLLGQLGLLFFVLSFIVVRVRK